jgi:hypothetical protein
MIDANTRAWIYRVVLAGVPLLVTLGLLTGEVAGHILTIAAAVLGVAAPALALGNITPDEVEVDLDLDKAHDINF